MPENVAHEEIYRGYKIKIFHDTDPQNPRKECDNLATMICFHRKYNLGDEHKFSYPRDAVTSLTGKSDDELGQNPNDDFGDGSEWRMVWEPLYLYDHSGITMSTTPFSCRFDSGQVGFIYTTYDKIQKELNVTWTREGPWTPSAEVIDQYEKRLKDEVETYDQYLRGNVYGFRIYAESSEEEADDADEGDEDYWNEDEEDACWGFFGDYNSEGNGALQAAKESVDAIVDKG